MVGMYPDLAKWSAESEFRKMNAAVESLKDLHSTSRFKLKTAVDKETENTSSVAVTHVMNRKAAEVATPTTALSDLGSTCGRTSMSWSCSTVDEKVEIIPTNNTTLPYDDYYSYKPFATPVLDDSYKPFASPTDDNYKPFAVKSEPPTPKLDFSPIRKVNPDLKKQISMSQKRRARWGNHAPLTHPDEC